MATVVARNVNEAVVGFSGISVWPESGDGRFCVSAFERTSVFSRREDIFTFSVLYKNT
jgi:hypothetical protein